MNSITATGDVSSYDVMYVCGGNTFYLLQEVRKNGFDKYIVDFINNGGLYVGVSAGSILVGPDIFIASPFDENSVGLTDTKALGVTDTIICPHYQKVEERIVAEVEEKAHCKVVRLRDDQSLEEIDSVSKIIE